MSVWLSWLPMLRNVAVVAVPAVALGFLVWWRIAVRLRRRAYSVGVK